MNPARDKNVTGTRYGRPPSCVISLMGRRACLGGGWGPVGHTTEATNGKKTNWTQPYDCEAFAVLFLLHPFSLFEIYGFVFLSTGLT